MNYKLFEKKSIVILINQPHQKTSIINGPKQFYLICLNSSCIVYSRQLCMHVCYNRACFFFL